MRDARAQSSAMGPCFIQRFDFIIHLFQNFEDVKYE
jgi:hypothetical protein